MDHKWSHFRKVAKYLKKNADADCPIYIRRVKMHRDLDGTCELRTSPKKHYLICINRKLSEHYSIDVALHEVAHAMSWGKDKDFHGRNWGVAYSKIYRRYLKEFDDGDEQFLD